MTPWLDTYYSPCNTKDSSIVPRIQLILKLTNGIHHILQHEGVFAGTSFLGATFSVFLFRERNEGRYVSKNVWTNLSEQKRRRRTGNRIRHTAAQTLRHQEIPTKLAVSIIIRTTLTFCSVLINLYAIKCSLNYLSTNDGRISSFALENYRLANVIWSYLNTHLMETSLLYTRLSTCKKNLLLNISQKYH